MAALVIKMQRKIYNIIFCIASKKKLIIVIRHGKGNTII